MNKIKIINLPEITVADNTTYIPVSTGVTNKTRKISAGNLIGFNNVSYLPQLKTTMEMSQARENIGAVRKSFAEIEDRLSVLYSADPLDPNGDEVFKIENSNSTDGPDVTVNDWGYMYLRKGIYLAAGADIEGVTSADFFNIKGTTSPVQAQLDSKASAENATFTGITNFEGDVQVSEDVIVDGNVRAYSNTVDTRLQFGAGAKIKIQTGVNGGTPIYREFPATELSSSDLNGTQYVMVYGTGTPEENAAELQAAYNEAKKMPRHIGTFNSGSFITIYKGQTFANSSIPIKFFIATTDFTGTIEAAPAGTFEARDLQSELDAALARRVSVIVAPGEYDFGATAFTHDTQYINIISLTGEADVIVISSKKEASNYIGINVIANNSIVKGINCKTTAFRIANNLDKLICESCIGGNNSFGPFSSGTFLNCTGGEYSFSGFGSASGTYINCTGGNYSFGGNSSFVGYTNASGTFTNCKGGNFSFGGFGMATGTFTNCTGREYSFGYKGYASGIFKECIGANDSFGSYGTASGTFIDCISDYNSFGYNGIVSGKFINCILNGVLLTHSNKEIDLIINDDGIFQNIKLDGQGFTPVAHPNYSTQATILPQKFGNQLVYQKVIMMTNPNLGVLPIPPLQSYDNSIIPLSANIISVKGYYGVDIESLGRKGVIVLTSGTPNNESEVNVCFEGDLDGSNKRFIITPSNLTRLREVCLIIEYTMPTSEYGYGYGYGY